MYLSGIYGKVCHFGMDTKKTCVTFRLIYVFIYYIVVILDSTMSAKLRGFTCQEIENFDI